jgi:hypothetical protein
MIPVREFTNGADVLAHAAEIRRKFFPSRQIIPTQVPTTAKHAASDTHTGLGTRQNNDLFPAKGDSLEPVTTSGEVVGSPEFIQQLADWFALDATPALANHNTARRIVRECAERHGVTPNDVIGGRKLKAHVAARHEAIAAVYVALWPTWTLPKIGAFFGGRDHTTIMHAAQKMGVWKGGTDGCV